MDKQIGKKLVNGLGAVPIVWLGILYLFTVLCWINLGHFPIPSLNDPKGLGHAPLRFLSIVGMLPVITTIATWLLLLPLTIQHKLLTKRGVVIMVIGSTIALIQLFLDPFNIILWLLD